MEHRFSKHSAANGHKVEPTDQLAIHPCLDAVSHSGMMKSNIGLHHRWNNPGTVRAMARAVGTGSDHLFKGDIHPNLACRGLRELLETLFKRGV